MNTLSVKLDQKTIDRLINDHRDHLQASDNPYVAHLIRLDDCLITVYHTQKVLFQGNKANEYALHYLPSKVNDEAGSDEVGTGDYFGPVCVCACIVSVANNERLKAYPIKDSKKLTDKIITDIAPELMKILPYSLLILDNIHYNEVHKTNHMVQIKSRMHNQAYINLINKGFKIPKAAYVDQFVPASTYFRYLQNEKAIYRDLIFETKAEDHHIAVAAASIIARYAFIKSLDQLSAQYKMNFHKGSGPLVDEDIRLFREKYGDEQLYKVAKLHFKNTAKSQDNDN